MSMIKHTTIETGGKKPGKRFGVSLEKSERGNEYKVRCGLYWHFISDDTQELFSRFGKDSFVLDTEKALQVTEAMTAVLLHAKPEETIARLRRLLDNVETIQKEAKFRETVSVKLAQLKTQAIEKVLLEKKAQLEGLISGNTLEIALKQERQELGRKSETEFATWEEAESLVRQERSEFADLVLEVA